MSGEPQEVEVEVIEPVNLAKAPEPVIEYTLPTVAVGNTDEIDAFVEHVESFFGSVEIDPTDREQAEQLAGFASDVKKIAERIDGKRKQIDREIKTATSTSTTTLNGLRDRLMGVYKGMREQISNAEELQKQARLKLLSEEYQGVAPDLIELIPLEVFIAKEPKLVSRDKRFTGNKACDMLDGLIADAVHDRARIAEGDIEFSTEADMVYCRTLDLRKALDENDRLKRQKAERESHKQAATRLDVAIGKAQEAVLGQAPAVTGVEPSKTAPAPEKPAVRYLYRLEFEAEDADAMKVRDYMKTLPGLVGKSYKRVKEVPA